MTLPGQSDMNPLECHNLANQMVEAIKKLENVDCTVEPSDAQLDAWNALREASHDLLQTLHYIIDG